MMYKCKLTVLETTFNEKQAKEFGAPGIGKCPLMREGQVFYADYAKPEGFCDEAWKAIYQYVFALSNGANMTDSWYYGDWMNEKHKDKAICSCNDGIRPVIIKVERTDEVSEWIKTIWLQGRELQVLKYSFAGKVV